MVYDRFQVTQNVGEVCDKVRKTKSWAEAGMWDWLEQTWWI
jgi:hypothetical protein